MDYSVYRGMKRRSLRFGEAAGRRIFAVGVNSGLRSHKLVLPAGRPRRYCKSGPANGLIGPNATKTSWDRIV